MSKTIFLEKEEKYFKVSSAKNFTQRAKLNKTSTWAVRKIA